MSGLTPSLWKTKGVQSVQKPHKQHGYKFVLYTPIQVIQKYIFVCLLKKSILLISKDTH